MSVLKFINNIYNKKKIPIYNLGNNIRDFTFIDDIVGKLYLFIKFLNQARMLKIINQIHFHRVLDY